MQSAAQASMTHPACKLRWIKPANLEQIRNFFLNTSRFLSPKDNQQDAKKFGYFEEVVDLKTLDFFAIRRGQRCNILFFGEIDIHWSVIYSENLLWTLFIRRSGTVV